jgi:ATP-dependent protease HslVU (ClpYQ) peptidase subunit
MTTIACNRESMAADSRTSFGDGEFTVVDDKIERIGSALVGCAGSTPAIWRFLQWFRNQERGIDLDSDKRPEFTEDEFHAVVLNASGIFWYANSTYPSKIKEPFFAMGSGSQAAKAAMLCGKSPADAVAIALKCDKNSGPPVRSFQLDPDR